MEKSESFLFDYRHIAKVGTANHVKKSFHSTNQSCQVESGCGYIRVGNTHASWKHRLFNVSGNVVSPGVPQNGYLHIALSYFFSQPTNFFIIEFHGSLYVYHHVWNSAGLNTDSSSKETLMVIH